MGHSATINNGFAGEQGYDSSVASGRGPLEKGLLDPSGFAFGVPMDLFRPFKIVPLQALTNNLATSQDPASAVTLTAGTGVTKNIAYTPRNGTSAGTLITVYDITGQGASAVSGGNIQQIVERSVTVTSGGTTPFNVTVAGFDMYNQAVSCTFQGKATGSTATAESNKTFAYVQSVTVSADPGVNITVGTGDTFGFPVAVNNFDQFLDIFWNNIPLTSPTGFTAADLTSPTTVSTGNVRGSYKLQSVTSNGTTALTAYIWLPNPNNLNIAYGIVP